MTDFILHPGLVACTSFIADWPLCRVLLLEDARYPWAMLVPRLPGIVELTDLAAQQRAQLMEEAARVAAAIKTVPGVVKLNIGALGNMVPQFHFHVIGRWPGDPAWPGPAWGQGAPVPRDEADRARLTALVSSH